MAVGSRGIQNLALIVQNYCGRIAEHGSNTVYRSAMGSHGGGTAKGQTAVLEGYGITEEAIGIPVKSSLEVVEIGTVECESGTVQVVVDHYAAHADLIILLEE